MTVKDGEALAKRVVNLPKLAGARKVLILGLNRDLPGFGDDAVLIDREAGGTRFLDGIFRRGSRALRDASYQASCDEYRENGWAYEEDEAALRDEEDLYGDSEDEEAEDEEPEGEETEPEAPGGVEDGAEEDGAIVRVPLGARFMDPGTTVAIAYDQDEDGGVSEGGVSDSYWIEGIEGALNLSFHANRTLDGILLDEDFFRFPLVCWNTGSRPIKVEGRRIPVGDYLLLLPSDPGRRARRLRHEDIMSLPLWDSQADIEKTKRFLLALGCPPQDAEPLAIYFWGSPGEDAESYSPADHTAWMDRVYRRNP